MKVYVAMRRELRKSSVCSRAVAVSNQEQSLAQKLAQTMHAVYVETST